MNKVQQAKPRSIEIVSIILMVVGGVTMLCNLMAFIMFFVMDINSPGIFQFDKQSVTPLIMLFINFKLLCAIMVSLGLCLIIAGYHFRKLKNWSRYFITFLSIIYIIMIWMVMLAFLSADIGVAPKLVNMLAIINAIVWSLPLVWLLIFVNKTDIKHHFAALG